MRLLYAKEHTSCVRYEKNENPTIKHIAFEEKESRTFKMNKSAVAMVLEGSGAISFGRVIDKPIKKGDMLLLPTHTDVKGKASNPTTILLIYLPTSFSFCDHFSLEMLHEEWKTNNKKLPAVQMLKMNEYIYSYVNSFLPVWQDGLRCSYYTELKIKELFFLLRGYNTKEDLAAFFSPILTNDMEFYNLILANYTSVKTAKELANLTNYSLTGFEKKFRKIFGMSAHQWMRNQLTANIYHEINCTRRTFTEISIKYGFSSSAHFSNYCKTAFGMTPKAIRQKKQSQFAEE